jgi:DnaJ-class molecular chaperone
MFFGGQGGRQAAQKKQMAKVKPTKKGLEITLEDIYNGKIIKV